MPTFDATAGADLIAELTAISIVAATAILGARGSGGVRVKADGSPVTNADEAADAVIREGLARLQPGLPAISEEQVGRSKMPAPSERYFLVDPLDGTRDFIAGLDEYTVNIGSGLGRQADPWYRHGAGARAYLARHRRPRRRAAAVFRGQHVGA